MSMRKAKLAKNVRKPYSPSKHLVDADTVSKSLRSLLALVIYDLLNKPSKENN